ncbi:hypothetical protein DFH08DRAFT_878533 [Mycena albidolilacea]|uniref:Uncharacterized protein n=1 Tax=Mycena albidolilacea TaxID=1033008 RepID=A0AAD6ZRQ9_9AGAR|nr:hypothetical protein DFH08DRAFT_878533 [Mycena albidolilacea]
MTEFLAHLMRATWSRLAFVHLIIANWGNQMVADIAYPGSTLRHRPPCFYLDHLWRIKRRHFLGQLPGFAAVLFTSPVVWK